MPDGVTLGSRAFFPADANHDLRDYKYHIPESKDLTSHPSADIPMIGDKGEGNVYAFTHCCGATKLTVTNIPDIFVAVEISVKSASLKLSGTFGVFTDEGVWRWNPAAAGSESEKSFTRKVSVSNNTASIYIPYASGEDWWSSNTLDVTGYDSYDIATDLITGKSMKSIGSVARAHVKPLTPLILSKLGFIDWTDAGIPSFGSSNSRIVQWKATSDPYYIYFQYKITAEKIKWETENEPATAYDLSYDKSYIYTGFNTDQNTETGGSASGGITLAGCEARSLVYPFTGTTYGTIEFKNGDDPRSYIQCPIGTSTGTKVTTRGAIDGTYVYVENAIPRNKIGSPSSGSTIDIQPAMDYYPANTGSITLE